MTPMPKEPPPYVVRMAISASAHGPCVKSKRGVAAYVAFDMEHQPLSGRFIVACANSPPHPLVCGKDDACKVSCGQVAVHAEEWAILAAREHARDPGVMTIADVGRIALVHVKTIDGKLVTSRGPSCVTCSRTILAVGIGGIWLYEATKEFSERGEWRFYTGLEFHIATLEALGLPVNRA